jgi:hypothetical protein
MKEFGVSYLSHILRGSFVSFVFKDVGFAFRLN